MKSTRDLISDELRSLRAKANLNLEEVALKTNISKDTLSRYERNQVAMNIDILEKILNFYDVNFDIFFTQIYAKKQN